MYINIHYIYITLYAIYNIYIYYYIAKILCDCLIRLPIEECKSALMKETDPEIKSKLAFLPIKRKLRYQAIIGLFLI